MASRENPRSWFPRGPVALSSPRYLRQPLPKKKARRTGGLDRESGETPSFELDVGDLAFRILFPDVDHVVQPRHVALLVEGDVADHRLEGLAGMHHVRN